MLPRTTMASLSGITTISFDADGTLWDFEKLMRRALERTRQELIRLRPCEETRSLSVEDMVRIREEVAAELRGRETNLERMRLAAFGRTLEQLGISDDLLAAEINAFYVERRFENVELFADVIPTLDALSLRYTIGMVSNGNGYPERSGLAERFSFVVFSQECGFAKPDPGIFEVALREASCKADCMLHVGDSLDDDVHGARNAGVRSAWLNRGNAANTTDLEPDMEIQSLAELVMA
jgi:FMN hydrolase / 5-amino-6-(5-phospho-D-ribitylamino)uracil phosphatase